MINSCATKRLLSDSQLRNLTQEYHLIDGSEIPLLIRLLWDIRHFEEDLLQLPLHQLQLLIVQVCEIDHDISLQIIEFCTENRSITQG